MAVFEHPSGNGHREYVGVPDLLGTLVLGGFYLILRRAPWPALQNFVLGSGVIMLALRIARDHAVLSAVFFVIFWEILAVYSLHAITTSYLRRGWKEVDPDDIAPPRDDAPQIAHPDGGDSGYALPLPHDAAPRAVQPVYGLAS